MLWLPPAPVKWCQVSSQRKRQALRPERPTTLPEWTEFILTVYGEVHAWVLLKQIDIEVVSNYGGQVVPWLQVVEKEINKESPPGHSYPWVSRRLCIRALPAQEQSNLNVGQTRKRDLSHMQIHQQSVGSLTGLREWPNTTLILRNQASQ